jgi:hypothetical protein
MARPSIIFSSWRPDMERASQDDPSLTTVPDVPREQRVRTAITLEELQNPVVCEALAAWERARQGRPMPSRIDMSPRVMRGFLKHTALIQVLDGGRDFRYRVVGDAVIIQQGVALNGMTTTDLDARIPGYGAQLARAYARVLRHRTPLAYRGLYFRPADKHTFSHESIMAPLGDDGEAVDHLIVVAA